jgi:hypothetical protein
MRYIPRGLRVDFGQGEVVMWMKNEVQGSDVVTRQDVRYVDQSVLLQITTVALGWFHPE